MEDIRKRIKIDREFLLLVVLCLLVEIFICNANSFRVLNSGKYEKKTYMVEQMETTGFDVTGNILTYVADYGEEASITIKNIDTNVGTMYLDLYLPNEKFLKYTLYYTDEANQYFLRTVEGEYVPGVERTKWRTCHFSGKSDEIKLVFDIQDDLYQMAVDAFTVNEPVKFHFSIERFCILLLIALGIYSLRCKSYFMEPFHKKSQAVLLGMVFSGVVLITWSLFSNSVPEARLGAQTGDIYSQHLTDALLDGKTELDIEPSEALKNLDNPYDYTEREAKGLERDVDFIWDTAYYEGSYYVYFGVVPALLFFVPYKMLTGMYLSTGVVVFVCFCIYMLFLNLLLTKCLRKVLPDTPFGLYLLGGLLLDAACGAFYFVSCARFYEMAYATGLMFSAMGLYLLFSSIWKKKGRYIWIFTGGLCMALAVGCRPTMVLYSFLLIPYLWVQFCKKPVKGKWSELVTLAVPYLAVAVLLMWYNAERFGSIVDFGQNYQITATDMAKNAYNPAALPWSVWLGMFQPLNFAAQFPFVQSGNSSNDFAGYFYHGGKVLPMFSGVPLLYLMFVPTLWKSWKRKISSFGNVMLGTVAGMGWGMALIVFVSAGVHLRYTVEAIPLFVFVVVLLCGNCIGGQEGMIRKNLMTGFAILTLYSILTAFLFGIVGEWDWIFVNHPEFYYMVERAFCFWK